MINLEKKEPINLSKLIPIVNHVKVGFSLDSININYQSADIDASVFMLGENGKIPSNDYFVFYNNLISSDESIHHLGDDRSVFADGDDEVINISLSKVNTDVLQITFVLTINNSDEGFHFGNIENVHVRVYDLANNTTICQYKLTESFAGCDALIISRFFRNGSEWIFEPICDAFTGGLNEMVKRYS